MMRNVYLLVPYPSRRLYGGILSYVTHLKALLKEHGRTVTIVCIGDGNANAYATCVPAVEFLRIARENHCLICHIHDNTQDENIKEFNMKLLKTGCPLVVQDSRVLSDNVITYAHDIVCTGRTLTKHINRLGKQAQYIPLPYYPVQVQRPKHKNAHGVYMGRISDEKRIDLIYEINELSKNKIWMRGRQEMRYVNFKLKKKYPDWDFYYLGSRKDEDDAVKMCAEYTFAVDFSQLPEYDMGRTQYTFLEAMNANVPLVIHKDWEAGRDEMVDGRNCIAVDSAQDFCNRWKEIQQADFTEAYEEILFKHHEDIANMYIRLL